MGRQAGWGLEIDQELVKTNLVVAVLVETPQQPLSFLLHFPVAQAHPAWFQGGRTEPGPDLWRGLVQEKKSKS